MGNVCMSALSANEAAPAPECFSELLVKIAVEFFSLSLLCFCQQLAVEKKVNTYQLLLDSYCFIKTSMVVNTL